MKRIVTFGEIMLRLAPEGYYRFFQNDKMQATFGGGEANVAVALAQYGMNAAFVTKLPDHAIGQAAINSLRYFGVDTDDIALGGERIGVYYLEKGASQRASVCIYDRNHSSIQTASEDDFDWDDIFTGADWFHFTGITPALSDNLAKICKVACIKAKEKGLTVSCDTNYRSKLWSLDKASSVMKELMQHVDVCLTNPGDAKDLFGIVSDKPDYSFSSPNNDGAISIAKKLHERFDFSKVAMTLRSNKSASDNDFAGLLYDGSDCRYSKEYHMHIVDRVGGGDSFGSGLIYALLSEMDTQSAIDFAVAASVLKHSIEGDFNRVTVEEVKKLASSDGSGRIQR